MCGRYTIRRIDLFVRPGGMETPPFDEFDERRITPRFNVAPSQDVPVVRLDKEDLQSLGFVRWGLIPHWAKGSPKLQPINARAETVRTSGMFRQAFARRRCILPADGFYEWRKLDAKTKQPMFIHFPDDRVFGFAGLWERWSPGEDAEPVDTCTVITTTPNALMTEIHDRMPVILRPEDYAAWLARDTGLDEAAKLMRPYAEGEMVALPVSKLVNSPRNDVAECVRPLAD